MGTQTPSTKILVPNNLNFSQTHNICRTVWEDNKIILYGLVYDILSIQFLCLT